MDHFERELARMMRDAQEHTPFEPKHQNRLRSGVRARRRARAAQKAVGSVLAVAGLGVGFFLLPHHPAEDRPQAPLPRPATSPSYPKTRPTPTSTPDAPPSETSTATPSITVGNTEGTTTAPPTTPTTTGSSATVSSDPRDTVTTSPPPSEDSGTTPSAPPTPSITPSTVESSSLADP
ncbi:hypothetical protein [Streptomyces sp. NPDC001530]|uniref:hypothetical protein n=1 Tax=Streptomyces sp. NPDC001530 TaxID=3364582 RepID=UPI0036927BDB